MLDQTIRCLKIDSFTFESLGHTGFDSFQVYLKSDDKSIILSKEEAIAIINFMKTSFDINDKKNNKKWWQFWKTF